jgi:hypothetical protein
MCCFCAAVRVSAGNGFIQTIMLKAKGQPDAAGQRWWEGV